MRTARPAWRSSILGSVSYVQGPRTSHEIALTFDDGPLRGFTDAVLDGLSGTGHKATFFVLGRRAAEAPELLRRIRAEGHELGNHGYSHWRPSALRISQIADEIERTDELIRAATGDAPHHYRPPFGELSLKLLWYLKRSRRQAPVMFTRYLGGDHGVNVRSGEAIGSDLAEKAVVPGDIVLMHDTNEGTVAGMGMLLEHLQRGDLRSVRISELLGLPAIEGARR